MIRASIALSALGAAIVALGCTRTDVTGTKSIESDSGVPKGDDAATTEDAGADGGTDASGGEGCPPGNLLLTLTDYETISVAYLELEGGKTSSLSLKGLNQDTVPVTVGCAAMLLERGNGNLRFQSLNAPLRTDHTLDLDPEGVSTPYATNAQTIVEVSTSKAYVVALARNELIVIDPRDRDAKAPLRTIDLSPFVSKADVDGIVEATDAIHIDGRVYVALGRYWFDESGIHFDAGSVIAVVDAATDQVVDMDEEMTGIQGFPLDGDNPWRGLSYDNERRELWVGVAGDSFAIDGGIEAIDLETGTTRGYVLTEETLGGELEGFEILSTTRVIVKVGTRVVAWTPGTDLMSPIVADVSGMRVIGDSLFVWSYDDENALLSHFEASTGRALTPPEEPYSFGSLPIYGIAAAP